jgi:hypothetical protein
MPGTWAVLGWLVSAAGMPVASAERSCCFTNPAYTGVCRVTPTGEETCGSIHDYLNTPNSVGKTYCDQTTIRGGWQQTSCNAATGADASGADRRAGPPGC